MNKVSECQQKAFAVPGKRDAKQKEMTKLLKELGSGEHGKPFRKRNPKASREATRESHVQSQPRARQRFLLVLVFR